MLRLSYERRQQMIDACVGAAMVALTVVLAVVALWLVTATAVGTSVMWQWIGDHV